MKKLLAFGFGLFLAVAHALPLGEIDTSMKANVNSAMELLQKGGDTESLAAEIFALFDEIFDYKQIAKLSLSKHAKSLSSAQVSEYNKAFKANLKKSFVEKLKLYKNEKLDVQNGEQIKANRYNLKARLIADGQERFVTFKFYDAGGDWRIYDVDIFGISVVQTYRSQVDDLLKTSDFATLLDRLKNETQFSAK